MKWVGWVAVSMAAFIPACDIHFGPCDFLGLGPNTRVGNASFAYEPDAPLSRPMAAGGAHATVAACTEDVGLRIARVMSTNTNVLVVSANSTGQKIDVDLVTGTAGDSDLVLYDAADAEIARVTLSVANTTDLVVERGWGDAPQPKVLAGEAVRMHATTKGNGEILVGSGAVKFSTTGSLAIAAGSIAPADGDVGWFRGQPGNGSVVASCPSARTEVPVTVVDPSALTSISASATALRFGAGGGGRLIVSAFAGTQEVYGARCTWATVPNDGGLQINYIETLTCDGDSGLDCRNTVPGDALDSPPAFTYDLYSFKPGHYQATCTIPGGLTTSVTVDIDPS